MKILVLNYEFPPLGGGASPVSYKIAKSKIYKGKNITINTLSPRYLACDMSGFIFFFGGQL